MTTQRTHFVLPDCQVRPGDNLEYLGCIGKYIAYKKPDVIVNLGDFADMSSLSTYDVGTKAFEGRSYKADVEAAKAGMDKLMNPIIAEQGRLKRNKEKQWNPKMILTLGNHENRINRAINSDRKLSGLISTDDLRYKEYGWQVHDFLNVVVQDGIAYSHYMVSGVKGLAVQSPTLMLNKKHMSCIVGHQQGRQIAYAQRADGKQMTAIISGSCYEHDEPYMGPQGNQHWRGAWILYNVNDGAFDELPVPLDYIKSKYA